MGKKHVVIGIFESEAAADTAGETLKSWSASTGSVHVSSIGILVLDSVGDLKTDKIGGRSTGKGAGIGLVLAMATPIGLAAAIVGGGVLGALHHKGLGLSEEDRERLGRELRGGKAAVGVLTDDDQAPAVADKLAELGGAAESYELDDGMVQEMDAASEAEHAHPVSQGLTG